MVSPLTYKFFNLFRLAKTRLVRNVMALLERSRCWINNTRHAQPITINTGLVYNRVSMKFNIAKIFFVCLIKKRGITLQKGNVDIQAGLDFCQR